MHFFSYTQTLFHQLQLLLRQVTPAQYAQPLAVLHNSSIGQHLRHVIEFFEELEKGYESGTVNYDCRQRHLLSQTDPLHAAGRLSGIASTLNRPDKNLQLAVTYHLKEPENVLLATTYYREWVYNIEHTIHHMALIKAGVQTLENIVLPASFGMAVSTQRTQTACAR